MLSLFWAVESAQSLQNLRTVIQTIAAANFFSIDARYLVHIMYLMSSRCHVHVVSPNFVDTGLSVNRKRSCQDKAARPMIRLSLNRCQDPAAQPMPVPRATGAVTIDTFFRNNTVQIPNPHPVQRRGPTRLSPKNSRRDCC